MAYIIQSNKVSCLLFGGTEGGVNGYQITSENNIAVNTENNTPKVK